jgi:HPt (histidine-containing phosphotransfer) domain-containing protein
MGLKVICTRPSQRSSETVAGDVAFPRHVTDAGGNAPPTLFGGVDAKQPGETASRLLRVIPAGPENAICWKNFSVLRSLFSAVDLPAKIQLCLAEMDLHLLRVAQSRACRNFVAVARGAHAVGRIAGNLGAARASAAAQLLEQACHSGDHASTYRLLSILSQACGDADTALNEWLSNSATPGA